MALTTTALRTAWGPPCALQYPMTVTLNGGGRVRVDGRVGAAVHALDAILTRWDYRTRRADTGAYNCRRITGGTGYSLHAYGIALDLNWTTNPYGRTLRTDMPRGMIDAIQAMCTVNGKQVWRWGGDYTGNKDAMHFEVVCTPADLATGIAGAKPAKPPQPRPPVSEGTDTMTPAQEAKLDQLAADVAAIKFTVAVVLAAVMDELPDDQKKRALLNRLRDSAARQEAALSRIEAQHGN